MSSHSLPHPPPAIVATVTAYCDGDTVTAGNTIPKQGRTIAGPRWIPFGTVVEVIRPGYQPIRRVVEDWTHPRYEGRFDIFHPDKETCRRWGRADGLTVRILKFPPGTNPKRPAKAKAGKAIR